MIDMTLVLLKTEFEKGAAFCPLFFLGNQLGGVLKVSLIACAVLLN
jgi:hypothetical protein